VTEYEVRDRFGNVWDVTTSKAAAEKSRKALNNRQATFGPFTAGPKEEQ
jgi:hypothetical protein